MTTAATSPIASPAALSARDAFVATMRRDTAEPELGRLVAVLDALVAWSASHPDLLAMRTDARPRDTFSCERVGPGTVFWSARATRGGSPKLELCPSAGRSLTADMRAHARATLNAHSRETLADGDRLRIGFGALKNPAARTAVLALMDELLMAGVHGAAAAP